MYTLSNFIHFIIVIDKKQNFTTSHQIYKIIKIAVTITVSLCNTAQVNLLTSIHMAQTHGVQNSEHFLWGNNHIYNSKDSCFQEITLINSLKFIQIKLGQFNDLQIRIIIFCEFFVIIFSANGTCQHGIDWLLLRCTVHISIGLID